MCRRPEQRGQDGQALGRSRGGFTTKIHAKSDASGDIIAFDLTGGEASDGRHFETLLDIGPDIRPRAAICDKGYASKANRDAARARGVAPVIPHKANEKGKPAFFARTLYKARAHRAGCQTAQALQARRPPMRKDSQELQINRQLRRRPLLDQIRPHSLGNESF
jgi:transposase